MPATPLFHAEDASRKLTGRLGNLTKKESLALAALRGFIRKQGLSLGLVRGPGEQHDVCLLRFLRAQGFDERRALDALMSGVDWGANVGLSGLRGHIDPSKALRTPLPPGLQNLTSISRSNFDRQGRPVLVVRLGWLTPSLLDHCGKNLLLKYTIWTLERLLEQMASSMQATQCVIEGITVILDTKGWDLEKAGDAVLSLLQDVVEVGLLYYPERLGQGFVVNLPLPRSRGSGSGPTLLCLTAARALGLGVQVDAGRLRVLQGDLPQWAPELLKVVSPEQLPVEYGGTGPSLPLHSHPLEDSHPLEQVNTDMPMDPQGGTARSNHGASTRRGQVGEEWRRSGAMNHAPGAAVGRGGSPGRGEKGSGMGRGRRRDGGAGRPGKTPYTISGGALACACLALLMLLHHDADIAVAVLWALTLALVAREWVGSPVTCLEARSKVPLLHHTSSVWATGEGPTKGGRGGLDGCMDGSGEGGLWRNLSAGAGGGNLQELGGVSRAGRLWGARLDILEVVGKGQSGFDRFCISVQVDFSARPQRNWPSGGQGGEVQQWIIWRRLIEFVALRSSLVSEGCPDAHGGELMTHVWDLPPTLPSKVLLRRLEGWLQTLLSSSEGAERPLASSPKCPGCLTSWNLGKLVQSLPHQLVRRSSLPANSSTLPKAGGMGVALGEGAGTNPRQVGSCPGNSGQHLRRSSTGPSCAPRRAVSDGNRAGARGQGQGHSGAIPGAWEAVEMARQIPSLPPSMKAMFHDPRECRLFKVPEREENQWMLRNNRNNHSNRPRATPRPHLKDGGSSAPLSPLRLMKRTSFTGGEGTNPLSLQGAGGGAESGVGQGEGAGSKGRRGHRQRRFSETRSPSPAARRGGRRSLSPSPRTGYGLRHLVTKVKTRVASGKMVEAEKAACHLLHVDMVKVPGDNPLHRLDHIVAVPNSRASETVERLTSKQGMDGEEIFLFVVNMQLPRSYTEDQVSVSIVLYWGIPISKLEGEHREQISALHKTASPKGARSMPGSSPGARTGAGAGAGAGGVDEWEVVGGTGLQWFQRELLLRYIDIPFHRPLPQVAHGIGPGGGAAMGARGEGAGAGSEGDAQGGGRLQGGGEDEDQSESGILPDKDFRNMSLKAVTCVEEGRWTVRRAVGDGNAHVLSRKLTQRYFRGSQYMETDVEVGSSVAAESVVGVCLKETCVLDVGLYLEGCQRMLGCVRVANLDLGKAEPLLLQSTINVPRSLAGGQGQGLGQGGAGGGNLCRKEVAGMFEDTRETPPFAVRGHKYLSDKKKVAAGPAAGRLLHVDLFSLGEEGLGRVDHICTQGRAAEAMAKMRHSYPDMDRHFLFVVNIQCPGNTPVSVVLTWLLDLTELRDGGDTSMALMGLLRQYVNIPFTGELWVEQRRQELSGVDSEWDGALHASDFRNRRLKMFPRVAEGAWVVRKAVGSKPFLVGQKLTCRYFRGRGFMETDIDIGSSLVAYNATSVAMGCATSLVVDLGFGIQGQTEGELPEVLIGSVRLNHLNLEAHQPLYRPGQGMSLFPLVSSQPQTDGDGEAESAGGGVDKEDEGVFV
ncbi:unnamed protein product, partial [Discosporangium mesarthrocarpum]